MADAKNRVVLVDDDEDLLRLLIASFNAKGYETVGLKMGKIAIEYLSNEANVAPMCLLVLDRMLPDMDGLDILKAFRDKYNDKVPVLILSVLSSEKDVVKGLEKGAVDYVSKPFSIHVLLEKASKLIKR